MKKAEARVSLADFARKNPAAKPGLPCWACTIPEGKEIDEARRSGTPIVVIRRWLIQACEYGPDVATTSRLHHHFSVNRHHLNHVGPGDE